jgi:hypothetical protein
MLHLLKNSSYQWAFCKQKAKFVAVKEKFSCLNGWQQFDYTVSRGICQLKALEIMEEI